MWKPPSGAPRSLSEGVLARWIQPVRPRGPCWAPSAAHRSCSWGRFFHPVHFNYAFLQNQDRHVHLHVLPRYDHAVTFGGDRFEDPDYPSGAKGRTPRVTGEALSALAMALQNAYR